jgi:hypothetical protein
MLADFDPAVAGLAAQPFQLAGPDGGRDRRHVPDLLLVAGVRVRPRVQVGVRPGV